MIDGVARSALEAARSTVQFDALLSRHTSLRVGGPAAAIASPRSRDELSELLQICASHELPYRALGAGFNTLVLDGGFDGVAIGMRGLRGLEFDGDSLYAEAGTSHSQVTRFCIENGRSGLEFTAGIPGTVGGWIAMNAGIAGREVEAVIQSIEWITPDGAPGGCDRAELDFVYRSLSLPVNGSIVTAGRFETRPAQCREVRKEVDRMLAQRSETQPLDVPSCGSVFKNPAGHFAGQLIEAADLKGTRVGGAEISSLHANFIVNRGGATASDVLHLIERAREVVQRVHGIALETEVKIMGSPV